MSNDVTMPQMGVSVAEGTVVEWKKKVGDAIERDEIICSISTDKIDTDVESPAAGTLTEIIVDVGTTVPVGSVLARIGSEAEVKAGGAGSAPASGDVIKTGTGEPTAALTAPGDTGELSGDTRAKFVPRGNARGNGAAGRISPVVARIAAEHNLDLSKIMGSGRGGRIRKQDVLAAAASENSQVGATAEPPLHIESPYRPDPSPSTPKSPAGEIQSVEAGVRERGPLSRIRQSIGQHMLQSLQTTATCTTIIEADMSRIEAARKGKRLTYLPFIARATIETLLEYGTLNATLENETFTTYEDVNLGVAVSLGQDGLIVPVIRRAQELSVDGLSSRIKEVAGKARTGQLRPDDVAGATFTITNPGSFGSIIATPVINQPQVAILDTEAVVKRPVVVTDADGNDSIAIRPMTYLCLSWDHRALDGALAAQFLASLRDRLQSFPS